jgi:hypothetical protein
MANETIEEHAKLTTAQLARYPEPTQGDVQPTHEDVSRQVTEPRTAMFPRTETEDFRKRWNDIQADFVDSPRQSVQKADELVDAIIQRLAEVFSAEQEKLESNWGAGRDISTEELRQALQRYRSFFDRLLSL